MDTISGKQHLGSGHRTWRFALLGLVAAIWLGTPAIATAAGVPQVGNLGIRQEKITRTTITLGATVFTNGSATEWKFEYATAIGGPWAQVPGGSGTLPADSEGQNIQVTLNGLQPGTEYWVRLKLKNGSGEAQEPPENLKVAVKTVPTSPRASCCQIREVTGGTAVLRGVVRPDGFETTWRFEVTTTPSEPSSWNVVAGATGTIPASEADEEFHQVVATIAGLDPEKQYYVRVAAENTSPGVAEFTSEDLAQFESEGVPKASTFATHTFDGSAIRVLGSVVPHGRDTHYFVEYTTDAAFQSTGWTGAQKSSETDSGNGAYGESDITGYPTFLVGVDLPGIDPGVGYHYRMVAVNALGTTHGEEQALTAPVPGSTSTSACANEAFRVGLSAQLPDCRAYEQVTPVEKGATMDIGTYGSIVNERWVAEGGERIGMGSTGTQWGESPDAKESSYFFTRGSSGWQMTSTTPQPEAGAVSYVPQVLDANLQTVDLKAAWLSTPATGSPDIELKTGPPGGPYTTVVSVPREDPTRWVGASADNSKLILQTADHSLQGHPTGTVTGNDLYEYYGGTLRQLNVTSAGTKLGSCGAQLVRGDEGYEEAEVQQDPESSSPHAVSADGVRVFFEATPGIDCGEPTHLFVRSDSAETRDLGAYRFLAASENGQEALLTKGVSSDKEYFLADTGSGTIQHLFTTHASEKPPVVAPNLSAIYVEQKEQIPGSGAPPIVSHAQAKELETANSTNVYRYDVHSRQMQFIAQASEPGSHGGGESTSPDGRYYYFASAGIAGVAGAALLATDGPGETAQAIDVYRYDSVERVLQCMSCASSFNPAPRLGSSFLFGDVVHGDGEPNMTIASSDGDFVFFETTAALVPQDVDGEIPNDPAGTSTHYEYVRSPSSDTYEWRRNGVDGCGAVQGCLSLISGGRGGYRTELIGTTPSGRDVFFVTHEALVGQDADTAGDIYDARIGGGYPAPAKAAGECEGNVCFAPAAAPVDETPGSLVFSGPGNALAPAVAGVQGKSKPKPCDRGRIRRQGRCVRRAGRTKKRGVLNRRRRWAPKAGKGVIR